MNHSYNFSKSSISTNSTSPYMITWSHGERQPSPKREGGAWRRPSSIWQACLPWEMSGCIDFCPPHHTPATEHSSVMARDMCAMNVILFNSRNWLSRYSDFTISFFKLYTTTTKKRRKKKKKSKAESSTLAKVVLESWRNKPKKRWIGFSVVLENSIIVFYFPRYFIVLAKAFWFKRVFGVNSKFSKPRTEIFTVYGTIHLYRQRFSSFRISSLRTSVGQLFS